MDARLFARLIRVAGIFILGLVVGGLFLAVLTSQKVVITQNTPRFKCTEITDDVKVIDDTKLLEESEQSLSNPGYDVQADVMQVRSGQVWQPDLIREQQPGSVDLLQPGLVTNVVHYLWCEKKIFEFQHYLSVLSVARVINPDRIIFHYTNYPRYDTQFYNTWFEDMKKELPFIQLDDITSNSDICSTPEKQKDYIVDLLYKKGGIYVHFNTIFMEYGIKFRRMTIVDGLSSVIEGFLAVHEGVHYDKSSADVISTKCPSAAGLSKNPHSIQCVIKKGPYHPKDAWNKDDIFSQSVNTLLYGSTQQPTAQPSNSSLVPNIGHLIWIGGNQVDYLFYLNCLSQIYVLKVNMLYVHGDMEPTGKYWDLVKREGKVRFVKVSKPNLIFRNRLRVVNHMADIYRIHILSKYGGIYSDSDVIWTKPIPDTLRHYDAVATYDWPQMYQNFPDYVQSGVMLGKPGARYWNYVLHSFKTMKDEMYGYNGLLRPYKVLERHPDLVYVYDKLQVMCWNMRCHPTWYPDFRNKTADHRSYPDFNWRTAHAFHWTDPTPEELKSEDALRASNTIFAEMGRLVLQAAGKL